MSLKTSRRLGGAAFLLGLVALLVLTLGSFGLSFMAASGLVLGLALGIAGIQVLVIAVVFMHLYETRFGIQVVALVTVLWIALLVLGVLSDVAMR